MQYTMRMTGLAWYNPDPDAYLLMHLGAAASEVFPPLNTVTINSGPQSNLLPVLNARVLFPAENQDPGH